MATRNSVLTLACAILFTAAPGFAAENPFASPATRYLVAADEAGKCGGKSAEGAKCGGMKAEDAKCSGKKAPAKADKKKGDGKCGAGKCGMKQPAEGKCGK